MRGLRLYLFFTRGELFVKIISLGTLLSSQALYSDKGGS